MHMRNKMQIKKRRENNDSEITQIKNTTKIF